MPAKFTDHDNSIRIGAAYVVFALLATRNPMVDLWCDNHSNPTKIRQQSMRAFRLYHIR